MFVVLLFCVACHFSGDVQFLLAIDFGDVGVHIYGPLRKTHKNHAGRLKFRVMVE